MRLFYGRVQIGGATVRKRDAWLWRAEYAGRAIRAGVGVLVEVGLFVLFFGGGAALLALAYWLIGG